MLKRTGLMIFKLKNKCHDVHVTSKDKMALVFFVDIFKFDSWSLRGPSLIIKSP